MAAMRKAEGTGEVRRMGLGALVGRLAVVGAVAWVGVSGGGWVMDRINGNSAIVEPGYVSPKSLSIQGKKNGQGNIETYLNHKNGEETVSLPCRKGPEGPLCGTVEYWWKSVGSGQREELVVEEWSAIGNDAKHSIMTDELQKVLDAFYGANGVQKPLQQPQQQYQQPKQK